MSPSLTVMRSSLPRRSFVFNALRRASTCGLLKSPASAGIWMPWPLLIVASATLASGRSGQARPVRGHERYVLALLVAGEVDLAVVRVPGHGDVGEVVEPLERRLDRRIDERERDGSRGLTVERERERAAARAGDVDLLDLVRPLAVEGAEAAGVAPAGRRVVTGDQP